VNLAVHFIRTRSSLILKCSSSLFLRVVPLLYITLLVGMVEGKKRIVRGGGGGNRSSLTGRIVFHVLFML